MSSFPDSNVQKERQEENETETLNNETLTSDYNDINDNKGMNDYSTLNNPIQYDKRTQAMEVKDDNKEANTEANAPHTEADFSKANEVIKKVLERLQQPFTDNDLTSIIHPLLELLEKETNAEVKTHIYNKVCILIQNLRKKGHSEFQLKIFEKVSLKIYGKKQVA